MHLKKLFLPLFLCTVISGSINAQLVKIPFELEGNHLFIKIKTKDSDSLRFVFDSGTTGASIDSAVARKAGIYNDTLRQVVVNGSGGSQSYSMAMHQNLKIKDLEISDINFVLTDFTSLSSALKTKIDGIIGYEVLNKFVTEIDFDHREISFYHSIKDVDTSGSRGIKFEFSKNILIPRFPISITLNNGESFNGKVMFDTGNAYSLLVSTPFSKFHNFNDKIGEKGSSLGRGANTTNNEQIATIKSMNFNGFDFGKMTIRLTVNDQAEPRDGYLGILGVQVIKRFNIIFDYANQRIYLKPNTLYHDPYVMEKIPRASNPASKAFLEKNKSKAGVQVTASGLQFKILKKGHGRIPTMADRVKLHFTTKLINGQKLWSTYDSNTPWSHHLDKALPGLAEAVLMMPVGSKWLLYIPASLAFGDAGDEKIPAGEALIYEVEVLGIQ